MEQMTEFGEAQQTALESRASGVMGGIYPSVAYALSFYPDLAEKFISIQEVCAKNMGSRGFWFTTERGWKGKDILYEISEANGIRLLENEVSRLRGEYPSDPEYYPDTHALSGLVETYKNRGAPLEKATQPHLIAYEDMRRKAIEKLGVTDEEIARAEGYLAAASDASKREEEARKLEEEARKIKAGISSDMQRKRDEIKSTWKK